MMTIKELVVLTPVTCDENSDQIQQNKAKFTAFLSLQKKDSELFSDIISIIHKVNLGLSGNLNIFKAFF